MFNKKDLSQFVCSRQFYISGYVAVDRLFSRARRIFVSRPRSLTSRYSHVE